MAGNGTARYFADMLHFLNMVQHVDSCQSMRFGDNAMKKGAKHVFSGEHGKAQPRIEFTALVGEIESLFEQGHSMRSAWLSLRNGTGRLRFTGSYSCFRNYVREGIERVRCQSAAPSVTGQSVRRLADKPFPVSPEKPKGNNKPQEFSVAKGFDINELPVNVSEK